MCVSVCVLVAQSCLTLCNPMDLAHQAPLSMEFFRQEYWTGLPFTSPADLSNPGIKPASSALQADSLPSEPPGKPFYFSTWYETKDKPQKFNVSRENSPWDKNTQLRDKQKTRMNLLFIYFLKEQEEEPSLSWDDSIWGMQLHLPSISL